MSEWISVKDRLPQFGVGVLVNIYGNEPYLEAPVRNILISELCEGEPRVQRQGVSYDKYFYFDKWMHYYQDYVTHWMPLPPGVDNE